MPFCLTMIARCMTDTLKQKIRKLTIYWMSYLMNTSYILKEKDGRRINNQCTDSGKTFILSSNRRIIMYSSSFTVIIITLKLY